MLLNKRENLEQNNIILNLFNMNLHFNFPLFSLPQDKECGWRKEEVLEVEKLYRRKNRKIELNWIQGRLLVGKERKYFIDKYDYSWKCFALRIFRVIQLILTVVEKWNLNESLLNEKLWFWERKSLQIGRNPPNDEDIFLWARAWTGHYSNRDK